MKTSMKKRLRQFRHLNWTSSPSKRKPHGLSGVISIMSGLYLISHSLTGNLDPYYHSTPILTYVISTILNAIAGFQLSHLAWVETRGIFKRCALFQTCLSFYVLRFTPQYTQILSWLTTISTPTACYFIETVSNSLDIFFAIATVLCTLSFLQVALEYYLKSNLALSSAIFIGTFGLMLLSTYPIHLAVSGQQWWECIQNRYPKQNVGMVGFIYVPATVTFSLILFGATLYQRSILTEIEFGLLSGLIVMICLISTVLSQELHIPDVSTQRIYLPCVEPDIGSLERDVLKTLDFSQYARLILGKLLDVKFENELYSD